MGKGTKFIFITGGVVSGLGKGITGSSLGRLLKNTGLTIFMQKMDPYLNIDPGTMSPFEHGEVYVTDDGGETDLDLGHYERFIDTNLNKQSSTSAGKIYEEVLTKERKGDWGGKTVQVIPHITDAIKQKIYRAGESSQADVIITEIGGTVGDIESQPFIEAIRQVRMELGRENVLFLHVGLLPYLSASKEYKTKPIQHSVKELLSLGIQPDVIITRSDKPVEVDLLKKISLFCNIPLNNVIQNTNADTIYKVPLELASQDLHKIVIDQLKLTPPHELEMKEWNNFVDKINGVQGEITISVVGKYVDLPDAYLSVVESLKIAGYENHRQVLIKWIQAEVLSADNVDKYLGNAQGILIPGGFGSRGVEGMILASSYAREHNIPYLGICLGMQVATISMTRDWLNKPQATSTEFDSKTPDPVFDYIRGVNQKTLGGTLRLGSQPTQLKPGSLAHELYQSDVAHERHRHRYEFNAELYKNDLEAKGAIFSGIYEEKQLYEIVEIPSHPFFIASQYHPEFTSRPNRPNPLFNGFIQAIVKKSENN
ncbi:CTP synthase [Mesoplasma sp. JKS002658]|uniref:CTP synthase n=1 Tax=Mesoplasma whartonense TaxID=2878854 RepID=UPI0020229D93|nr:MULTISPECIES: CTP synthase [unclassified Mesoplasma]MCL8211461.1 CTP synthase [Mesoplasma sp. JKS002664]MCL8212313.1 CTP synthase [Mesoplasma sp. JKS002662]MCL8213461.1 CTP synthase [Mesoplasma sp. JKS002660]MCL8214158.1 CTP synthase [Mesoplasma sp. JKS002658]MCL8214798.1 CTP synthase [Mesoplasma sp. JKS002663]